MNSLSFCLLECFYLFFIYDVKFLLCIIFFVGRFFFYSLSTLTISSCFLLACEKYVGSPIVGPFYLMSYSFLLLLSKFSLQVLRNWLWRFSLRVFGSLAWSQVQLLDRVAVVQPLSRVWLFVTPWTAARQASLSSHLLELAQHVHWVSDAFQPSHPLSSPSPPAFNLSQHQGLF